MCGPPHGPARGRAHIAPYLSRTGRRQHSALTGLQWGPHCEAYFLPSRMRSVESAVTVTLRGLRSVPNWMSLLSAETYESALATMMSVDVPWPVYVGSFWFSSERDTSPSPSSGSSGPLGWIWTRTPPSASLPPVTAETLYCTSVTGWLMMRLMALKVASTGPEPMAASMCSFPSASIRCTVAVARTRSVPGSVPACSWRE
mmetsp:Transcript_17305/g.44763  ORF Transcript_17305/g.44763 Transcript_17305/m.44763 type:complete len:201 (-) Transcript_17305:1337-1939(-)